MHELLQGKLGRRCLCAPNESGGITVASGDSRLRWMARFIGRASNAGSKSARKAGAPRPAAAADPWPTAALQACPPATASSGRDVAHKASMPLRAVLDQCVAVRKIETQENSMDERSKP